MFNNSIAKPTGAVPVPHPQKLPPAHDQKLPPAHEFKVSMLDSPGSLPRSVQALNSPPKHPMMIPVVKKEKPSKEEKTEEKPSKEEKTEDLEVVPPSSNSSLCCDECIYDDDKTIPYTPEFMVKDPLTPKVPPELVINIRKRPRPTRISLTARMDKISGCLDNYSELIDNIKCMQEEVTSANASLQLQVKTLEAIVQNQGILLADAHQTAKNNKHFMEGFISEFEEMAEHLQSEMQLKWKTMSQELHKKWLNRE
jgi:quinol monooxygenase YgiN